MRGLHSLGIKKTFRTRAERESQRAIYNRFDMFRLRNPSLVLARPARSLPPLAHSLNLSPSLFRAALSLLPSTRYIPNFTVDKLCVLNSPLRHRAPPLFVLSLHSTNQPPTCQQTSLLPVNSRHLYDCILCKYSGYFAVCHRAPVSSLHQRIVKVLE